ncbi:hypothetical protein RNJ44_01976 [Nakaseomyces bracarensis]|uniref:Transmembrane protein n=1 Tax=Nakaseomyces bracarensis TaxID=273131 RepID=A0ABR4NPA9_9SACH
MFVNIGKQMVISRIFHIFSVFIVENICTTLSSRCVKIKYNYTIYNSNKRKGLNFQDFFLHLCILRWLLQSTRQIFLLFWLVQQIYLTKGKNKKYITTKLMQNTKFLFAVTSDSADCRKYANKKKKNVIFCIKVLFLFLFYSFLIFYFVSLYILMSL